VTNGAWKPHGATPARASVEAGVLLAWRHQAWRVLGVHDQPRERWTRIDVEMVDEFGSAAAPQIAHLRLINDSCTDPAYRDGDQLLRWWPGRVIWWIYPDRHYPVCAVCGEPQPCREIEAERLAVDEFHRAARYERPDTCPECEEPVTAFHRPIQFARNIVWPGGPAVQFHGTRQACRRAAEKYGQRLTELVPR
jgi:hypothetical protein